MNESATAAAEAPAAPAPPKGFWEKIITTTPVVLTVIATLLAGQSSSEMTRAQYSRSLASQNQSKVGDQWAYFQAKRTRTVILDKTGDLMDALTVTGQVDAGAIASLSKRLPEDLERAARDAERLAAAIARAKDALGGDAAALDASARRLLHSAQSAAAMAAPASKKSAETLAALSKDGQLQATLEMLNSGDVPKVSEQHVSDPAIELAQSAISDRKPETEIAQLALAVSTPTLRKAMDAAEANADAFDQASKPLDKSMRALNDLIAGQTSLIRELVLAVRDLKLTLSGLAIDEAKMPDEIRTPADRLDRLSSGLKASVDELSTSMKAGWNRFNARRYERDARYNQEAAFLYEIQVHQDSARADHHLTRSHNFFYGMLAAQMAVTIATLALAVRQRSLLWGLASVAGLCAVLYGATVYLDMVP